MDKRLYAAYGSNLNLHQMANRCPTARIIASSEMNDFRLLFRGHREGAVATVEPYKGGKVPILIWEITKEDEAALDRYEGWPYLYRKEIVKVKLKGKSVDAMVYIMNGKRPLGQPSLYYYSTILDGYKAQNFDVEILHSAMEDSLERMEYRNE